MLRRFPNLVPAVTGAVLAILALALPGCGEEPTPPRLISFSPAELTVPAGETLAVSVEYEENDFSLPDFQWQADAGEIEGNGAPSIVYHAPASPGDYKIAVSAGYGDAGAALSLDSTIKVTEATAAAPATAEATEPGTPPAEPSQAADRAATETAAAPPDTAAGAAVEQAETATEAPEPTAPVAAATEEAVTQGGAGATPPAGQAVEEMAAATEQATERPGTAVVEGAAAADSAAKEAAARAESDVAAVTEVAGGGDREAARSSAAATTGEGTAAETPPAAAPAAPDQQVAARTQEAGGATASAGSRLDQILERHRLIAIVEIAFKPFSFYGKDGPRTGFDVDMVREFARRWLDDPTAVTFLPVPTDARITTLQKGRADMIAAALTKTPERAQAVDFSLTYFKDGQRLLVRQDSAIADVCDLKGKKVAATEGSTSLDNIKAAAARCGFELGDDLVAFRRHQDAIEALLDGQVEAFTSDGIALENFALGQPLKVVGNHFSEEPYGFAVPKGDKRLLQLVDRTLKEMEKDGTYAAIYEKWFGDAIRPYPLEESEPVATEVAALATTDAPALVEPKTGAAPAMTEYVVRAGDTLSRIAGKVYGDVGPASWRRIYEANKAAIGSDPSRIKVGMTLTIPQ
jgi:putative glutamine transport system substrate-binding protein